MIRYHDPRPQRQADDATLPRATAARLRGPGPWHFGLLGNGFRDADRFLHHLAERLVADVAGSRVSTMAKASPPEPLRPEHVLALESCDAAILAYGH
jgi:hypothetical protein